MHSAQSADKNIGIDLVSHHRYFVSQKPPFPQGTPTSKWKWLIGLGDKWDV
jgi:hypothetical protein